MMKPSNQIVRCISCELSCQLYPESTVRSLYCGNSSFAIWPEGNYFLQTAVTEKILRINQNHLSRGFVFADFSLHNLRLLTDPLWIDRLLKTNMHIAIIADRKLAPLANYWFVKRSEIKGVIYADDDKDLFELKIKRMFSGRRICRKRGKSLNDTEFILLSRYVSGMCTQQIIKLKDIDVRKIYVHKLRLENKLGVSINKIIASVL